MPVFGSFKTMKKAAIYDPYIDTLGGGEKYLLTIAQILLKHDYQLDIFTNLDNSILKKAEDRFFLDLKGAKTTPDIFRSRGPISLLKKAFISAHYHVFIYLNDGSVPLLFSKNNYLHVQVPFDKDPSLFNKLLNLLKLSLFKKIFVNSKFTQSRVRQIYWKNSQVLYPPIDTQNFIPSPHKKNYIVSVGRFDNILNAKKQDLMIEAFTQLVDKNNLKNWQYILIGGSLQSEDKNNYLIHLKHLARKYPIKFLINASFSTLKKYYSESKIFWHAAGFGIDEAKNPQQTEHFGMSTVEAMAAGTVPIVVNKGGLKETVQNGVNGFLWHTPEELISKTQLLIGHSDMLSSMSQKAIVDSKKFSVDSFEKNFMEIIK